MRGKIAEPSFRSPVVMARKSSPSVQPLRLYGVMLGTCTSPGKPLFQSKSSPPPPIPSFRIGAANFVQSRCEWQSTHKATWLTRYSPLAIRSGVKATCIFSGFPTSGRARVINETAPTITKTIIITAYNNNFPGFFMIDG